MALKLADINGNPFIGVFCRLIGDHAICPLEATDEFTDILEETLGVKTIKATLGNTNLHGSLIGGNSRGFIVPYFYRMEEISDAFSSLDIDLEEKGIKGAVSNEHLTAWGNNILVNDRTALVNPDIGKKSMALLEETLGVEAVYGTIAGIKTVGSVAALNGNGMIVHPKITDDEKDILKDIFKIDIEISTVNFGSPYIGASLIANDKGAIVGDKTSGVEMNRIENILDIIE